jgi:hypothetical protein
LFALLPAAGINAPSVANDEQDRFAHGGAVSRRSARGTSGFPALRD